MRGRGRVAKMGIGAAVAVVAFAVGIVAWAAVGRKSPGGSDDAVVTNDPNAFTVAFGQDTPAPEVSQPSAPPAPPTEGGAPTPREAIEGFLRAEAEGRYAESFLFLSTPDRQNFPVPRWHCSGPRRRGAATSPSRGRCATRGQGTSIGARSRLPAAKTLTR